MFNVCALGEIIRGEKGSLINSWEITPGTRYLWSLDHRLECGFCKCIDLGAESFSLHQLLLTPWRVGWDCANCGFAMDEVLFVQVSQI